MIETAIKDVMLAEYIKQKTEQDFEWGVCDCTLFTGDWCEKLTGKNPAAGAHGKYNNKADAFIYLRDVYQNQPELTVDKLFKRVEPNFAQKGDIALCDLDGKKTFGIIGSRGFIFFKMSKGIVATKKAEKIIVWRVE